MLVLGIDPGTRHLGWGVVRREGNRLKHVDHGVLAIKGDVPLAARLLFLDEGLREVMRRFSPDAASVETLFFHKDAQAAAKLGHARGVVLLNVQRKSIELAEYAPAQVKQTVTGQGRATKDQVVRMITMLLSLDAEPRHDAADALALAVTHLRRAPLDECLRSRGVPPGLAALKRPSGARRRRDWTAALKGR